MSRPTAPHSSWSGTYERVQNYSPYRKGRGRRTKAECWTSVGAWCAGLRNEPLGSHASEAPRPETPCQVESGTAVPRNATRPCQENCRRPLRCVARPWQPRRRGRCHACSRAWPQTQKRCCAPSVGEGRNPLLKRNWCQGRLLRPFLYRGAIQRGSRRRQEDRGCTPSRQH